MAPFYDFTIFFHWIIESEKFLECFFFQSKTQRSIFLTPHLKYKHYALYVRRYNIKLKVICHPLINT